MAVRKMTKEEIRMYSRESMWSAFWAVAKSIMLTAVIVLGMYLLDQWLGAH